MERFRLRRIDEPDFGCEGRPDGKPVMDKVYLCSEQGTEQVVEVADAMLYAKDLNEGDMVLWDGERELVKAPDKVAVFFPGIGYHCDKPLLYYAKQLARQKGYEILEVPYGNFQSGVRGNAQKMMQAFFSALEQTEEILKNVCWENYREILFVSKSIGTAVAGAYAKQHELKTRNIFLTPVEQTFQCISQEGIVFHGTADPWAETRLVEKECDAMELPLYRVIGANHSLESEDAIENIRNLSRVMEIIERYM